jgi:hypothetical protein
MVYQVTEVGEHNATLMAMAIYASQGKDRKALDSRSRSVHCYDISSLSPMSNVTGYGLDRAIGKLIENFCTQLMRCRITFYRGYTSIVASLWGESRSIHGKGFSN